MRARRGETPLTIHLDGNDFGAKTLTLARASKLCQGTVTIVHPFINMLAKGLEASDFDAANPPAQAETDGFGVLPQPGKVSVKLSGKNVGPQNCQSLAAGLAQLTQLTGLILDLSLTNLGAEGGAALAGALAHLGQMTTLDLNLCGNDLGADVGSALAGAFAHLTQITTLSLDLKQNDLGDNGVSALAGAFAHLPQLTELSLDLSGRDQILEAAECKALGAAIAALPQLTTLKLKLTAMLYEPDEEVDRVQCALEHRLRHVAKREIELRC
eukprot:s1256_g9.t1